MGAIGNGQVSGFIADPIDSGGGKDVLSSGRRDARLNLLKIGTRGAVNFDPPAGAAIAAALLPEISFPGDAEDGVIVLFVEGHNGNYSNVALSVDPQIGKVVLAVVGHVYIFHRRVDSDLWHTYFPCRIISD